MCSGPGSAKDFLLCANFDRNRPVVELSLEIQEGLRVHGNVRSSDQEGLITAWQISRASYKSVIEKRKHGQLAQWRTGCMYS